MNRFRKILIGIISVGFILSLQGLIISAAVIPNIADKQTLQKNLLTRKSYKAFIGTFRHNDFRGLLEPTQDISKADFKQFENDKAALYDSIEKIITYKKYKTIITETTSGVFNWLEGRTQQPEFKVILASNQTETVELLEPIFVERFEALPVCDEDFKFTPAFSPLSTDCRPREISKNDITTYIQESAEDPDFQDLFNEISISGDDIAVSSAETAIAQQTYRWLRMVPLVLGALSTGLLIWLGLLSRTISSAIKTAGIVTLIAGVPLLLSGLMFTFLPEIAGQLTSYLTDIVLPLGLLDILLKKIFLDLVIFSLGAVIGGILLIGSSLILRRRLKQKNIYTATY